MAYSQYKVVCVEEGGCSTLLLGHAQLPLGRVQTVLNEQAGQGWQLVFQVIEKRRYFLFWTREALIITLGR